MNNSWEKNNLNKSELENNKSKISSQELISAAFRHHQEGNIEQAEKSLPSYEPKIYPKKKNDQNILIKKIITYEPKVYFKYANIYKIENLDLSEMEISNVGNSEESSQHFKDVFKLILLDFYFKIPNFEIKKAITLVSLGIISFFPTL